MSRSNIAFVLTGSIAGFKACGAISCLVQRGHTVRTVATESALRFVGPATLEGLTGERVLTDLFQAGAALEHIQLTRWADLVVVCPATANTINRFASGIADDLAGALFLAHDRAKPFLMAPAMNPAMWEHPATVEAVSRLSRWGVRFIPVGEGRTACGEVGDGRLAEPQEIADAIESALERPVKRLRVLVTSGGTAEPVDSVRVLTNSSTGQTGAGIANLFARRGHEVVHLRSRGSAKAEAAQQEEIFSSFADLDAALGRILSAEPFDAVIHAAAVSDYSVSKIILDGGVVDPKGKLDSGSTPVIHLRPNPKLVDGIRSRSLNESMQLVAFKLTHDENPEGVRRAVSALFEHSGADLIVHNDLSQRTSAGAFPAEIHFCDGNPPQRLGTRLELAAALERILTTDQLAKTPA